MTTDRPGGGPVSRDGATGRARDAVHAFRRRAARSNASRERRSQFAGHLLAIVGSTDHLATRPTHDDNDDDDAMHRDVVPTSDNRTVDPRSRYARLHIMSHSLAIATLAPTIISAN